MNLKDCQYINKDFFLLIVYLGIYALWQRPLDLLTQSLITWVAIREAWSLKHSLSVWLFFLWVRITRFSSIIYRIFFIGNLCLYLKTKEKLYNLQIDFRKELLVRIAF